MLTNDDILASLERSLAPPVAREYWVLNNLSPGLSASRVYAVRDGRDANAPRYILKIPDWDVTTGLANRDATVATREASFWQSPLPEWIRDVLELPKVLGIDSEGGRTLIWMDDISSAFRPQWTVHELTAAAIAAAELRRVYERNANYLEHVSWMARDVFSMYDAYVPEARNNLERVRRAADCAYGISHRSIDCLHACLDATAWACRELGTLSHTLVHGDYHARNIAFTPTLSPIVIDWANVGIGPIGSDIATLVSLYELFGRGHTEQHGTLDAQVAAVYCDALGMSSGERRHVEYSIWLWALTWGLHLRLGPGLTALLDDRITELGARVALQRDVSTGCERVVSGLGRYASPISGPK